MTIELRCSLLGQPTFLFNIRFMHDENCRAFFVCKTEAMIQQSE